MHNPESVLENEINKLLLDFEIQIDLLILVRWPDLVIVHNKKKKNRTEQKKTNKTKKTKQKKKTAELWTLQFRWIIE